MYTISKRPLWGMLAGSLVLLLTYVLSDYRDPSPLILGLTISDLLLGYGIISTVILAAVLKDPTLLFTRWYTALTLLTSIFGFWAGMAALFILFFVLDGDTPGMETIRLLAVLWNVFMMMLVDKQYQKHRTAKK